MSKPPDKILIASLDHKPMKPKSLLGMLVAMSAMLHPNNEPLEREGIDKVWDSIPPVPEFGDKTLDLEPDEEDDEEDEIFLTPQQTGGIMEGLQVGRIVHFVTMDGEHLAGIICYILHPLIGAVNMHVFNPSFPGTNFFASVHYSAEPKPYSWHFPERV
jgi:hypothetical protein